MQQLSVVCRAEPRKVSKPDPRVNIISLRMHNHAGPSGYHHAGTGLDPDPILIEEKFKIPARALLRLAKPWIENSGSTWYHRDGFWGECRAAGRWMRGSSQVFHFLYGENLYRYLGNLKQFWPRQNAIVATYHTPAWRMQELVTNEAHLQRLDAIVIMAESQREYLETLAPGVPVHFIPHGVNTDYFHPLVTEESAAGSPVKLVCVGAHLRDFVVFAEVARNLLTIDPEIEFHLVCNTKDAASVPDLPNIKKWSAVTDADLLRVYQTSTALLLPLIDSTANNALLEGMACGLPIISTELPGVHDYTSKECCVLAPKGDVGAMTEIVKSIGSLDLPSMAAASRRQAESLAWSQVRARLSALYLSLC